tara:strand:+ start:3152 stop:3328 length:177 start_codon:yes stop_codon:yes gene_type:complete
MIVLIITVINTRKTTLTLAVAIIGATNRVMHRVLMTDDALKGIIEIDEMHQTLKMSSN